MNSTFLCKNTKKGGNSHTFRQNKLAKAKTWEQSNNFSQRQYAFNKKFCIFAVEWSKKDRRPFQKTKGIVLQKEGLRFRKRRASFLKTKVFDGKTALVVSFPFQNRRPFWPPRGPEIGWTGAPIVNNFATKNGGKVKSEWRAAVALAAPAQTIRREFSAQRRS